MTGRYKTKNTVFWAVGITACLLCGTNFAFASEGVYVSKPTTQQEVNDLLKEFSRKVVINSVLESTGDLVENIVKGQNVQIYPQMASLAIQQVALQVFKNESLMETCRDAYQEGLNLLKEQRAQGISQEAMKNNVRNHVKQILVPIYDDRNYRYIVEQILEHSLREQQRIIVMHAAQKQVQLMSIQQQIQQMQQAAVQAYLSAIGP